MNLNMFLIFWLQTKPSLLRTFALISHQTSVYLIKQSILSRTSLNKTPGVQDERISFFFATLPVSRHNQRSDLVVVEVGKFLNRFDGDTCRLLHSRLARFRSFCPPQVDENSHSPLISVFSQSEFLSIPLVQDSFLCGDKHTDTAQPEKAASR